MSKVKVIVNGAKGNMGKVSSKLSENDADLDCVSQCDVGSNLLSEIQSKSPDVVLDFTHPNVVFSNTKPL